MLHGLKQTKVFFQYLTILKSRSGLWADTLAEIAGVSSE